jgi:predicted nucleotide-binding protein
MAVKKNTALIKEKTKLVITRDKFNRQLLARIKIGEEFPDPTNMEELLQLGLNFSNWNDYNKELLKQSFNIPVNEYYIAYKDVNLMVGVYDRVNTNTFQYKVQHIKTKIGNCLIRLNQLANKSELIEEDSPIKDFEEETVRAFYNRGFIVHGHNELRKFEVARFIENELKRKAIILHEQANAGQTIIEKFENNSNVDFAVALWTADDVGKGKTDGDFKDRARQNVIFETGYFIGKLGRRKVVVLYEQGVEIPSDYHGVIFILFDENWKDDLRREIETIYN